MPPWYDSANQVIREYNDLAEQAWLWTYDNAGNITGNTTYDYVQGTLGDQLSANTYTYGDDSWGDLLTAYNGTGITHDTIGNPLSDGTWTYTWEHGRELATMSNSTETCGTRGRFCCPLVH